MYCLLITGSREATPAMCQVAHACVFRAGDKGWRVLVGDAGGIDAAVIAACDASGVPVTVFGAYGKLRRRTNQAEPDGKNVALPCPSYPQRNGVMVVAASRCVGIWDGQSSGTRDTLNKAFRKGIPTYVWTEERGVWKAYP